MFVKCEEPDIEQLVANGSDLGPLWEDDSVEIFLQTADNIFYQFIVNSKSARWNGHYVNGKRTATQLELLALWNAATHIGDDFWSLELRVPWTTLDCEMPPRELRGNIARNIRTSSYGENSTWSRLKNSFLDFANFNRFVFNEDALTPELAREVEKNINQLLEFDIVEKGELYVGWSEVNITPDKPVLLQGQNYERISQYVQSEIVVSVLALETRDSSGKVIDQLMIGSCDLLSVPASIQAKVRENLQDKLPGFDLDKLFLCATHTHTAPVVTPDRAVPLNYVYKYIPDHLKPPIPVYEEIMQPEEYHEFLIERLCEAFITAWENRKPGLVNWQLGHAVVGHNRIVLYKDGSAKMYGSTDTADFDYVEGPVDHGVELLYFWDQSEKLTGVAVNVACPSQVVEGKYFISADFWDSVRKELRERFSPDLFILPLCGAAGDQSPRDLIRRNRGEPNMRDVQGAIELGKRIADAVTSKYESAAADKKDRLEFLHSVIELELPLRTVTQEEYEAAKAAFYSFIAKKQPGERVTTNEIASPLREFAAVMDRYERQMQSPFYTTEVHIIRLGDIAIATNPFELYTEYGLRIKARSRALQTFIVQLACDAGRYLPTARVLAGGAYGSNVSNNTVGPEGGEILVEETIKEINNLFSVYRKVAK